MEAFWDARGDDLRVASRERVLIHSDFKAANVKWRPATGGVLVFDWEFSWYGPRLFDLGQLLRWGAPSPFIAGLEAGYRDGGGVLQPEWRDLAEAFDLFNLMHLLGGGNDPARLEDCIGRIRQTLAVASG